MTAAVSAATDQSASQGFDSAVTIVAIAASEKPASSGATIPPIPRSASWYPSVCGRCHTGAIAGTSSSGPRPSTPPAAGSAPVMASA